MVQEYDISGENQDSSTRKSPKTHSSFAGSIVIILILLFAGIGGYYIYTKGLPFKLPFNLPSNKISARALQNAFDSMGYTKVSMGDMSNEEFIESIGSLGVYTIIESEVDVRQILGGYDANNIVYGGEAGTYPTMTAYIDFKTEDSASNFVNNWFNNHLLCFEDTNQENADYSLYKYNMIGTTNGTFDDGISYHFIHYTVEDPFGQTEHMDGVWQKGTDVYTVQAQGVKAIDSICDKLQIISPSTAFSMAVK